MAQCFLGRIAVLRTYMRPIVRDRVAWSVCRSVCLSVILVSPAKTAEPTEMPFGLRTRVGPRDHVLDAGPDLPTGRGNFEGKVMPADLSPLATAHELVRRLRCGGIIARVERVNSSSRGVRCGLSSNYFDHLFFFDYKQFIKVINLCVTLVHCAVWQLTGIRLALRE